MRPASAGGQGAQAAQSGASRFEFGIVMAIIAVLVGVAAIRLQATREAAETVAIQQLILHINLALSSQANARRIDPLHAPACPRAGQNPLDFVYDKPANYLGEFYAPQPESLPVGHWWFDRALGKLAYRREINPHFGDPVWILLKFKLKFSCPVPNLAGPSVAADNTPRSRRRLNRCARRSRAATTRLE
ncbi:MAG: type II secretion system protein [Massilia sp.]